MTDPSRFSAVAPPAPGSAEAELAALKARVAEKEAELGQSIDAVMEAVRQAVDWRRVVADHPLECALGAATLGFLVTNRPDFLGKSAEGSVKTLMGFGAESLIQAAVSHFKADSSGASPAP